MKRIVLILSALLCALCLAAFASADSLTYTLLEDGSGYEITGCEDLYVTEVTIPAAHENLPVLSIAGGAFYRCDQLTAFRTEEGQPVFYAEDGVLFTDQPVKTLVCFPAAYARNAYQAPADLMAVAPWAFAGQHTLDFLHFREGVESFGDYMLAYAGRPMMIYVPDSVKSIGKNLLQSQQYSVAFYGNENSDFCRFAWGNSIPFGLIMDWEIPERTLELAEPDLTEAEGLPLPDPDKVFRMNGPEELFYWDYEAKLDLSDWQEKGYSEIRTDLTHLWSGITPDADGKTPGGMDPRTGLYGMGFTEEEAVLRGYDRDGNLTGTRVVSGDFVFSLPGAYAIGVAGGKQTHLKILPYQPVVAASAGTLPLDTADFHLQKDGALVQFYIMPYAYASHSYSYPFYLNVFSYSFSDAVNSEAEGSPHYAMLILSLNDPYLLDECGKIAINFDHLNVLFENEAFTCCAASRYGADEEYGKQLNGILETLKEVMSGVYYPAGAPINHVSVRLTGEYPTSMDSVITLDDYDAEFNDENIITFAHEMTHAVDQTVGKGMPMAWMEGRAEYISRKVCDLLNIDYWNYGDTADWSFLSAEDKADFFLYYTEHANHETYYSVGYYFFRYLCDTYGEDVSARIMQNLIDAAAKLTGYEWNIPNDVFRKCVTDATDPDVFQNFVRDVIDKQIQN